MLRNRRRDARRAGEVVIEYLIFIGLAFLLLFDDEATA